MRVRAEQAESEAYRHQAAIIGLQETIKVISDERDNQAVRPHL